VRVSDDGEASDGSSATMPSRHDHHISAWKGKLTCPERIKYAAVGCGGMGRRHLRGMAPLSRTSFC